MAQYNEFRERSFKAGADLSAKQYFFVKLDTTQNQVVLATSATAVFGILKNAPKSGEVANVVMPQEGTMKVVAAGVIALGAYVTSDSSGKAVSTTTNKDICMGIALQAAAADGDIIEIALVGATLSL
jgi:hypothetical protein